jgi:hypothetical protein
LSNGAGAGGYLLLRRSMLQLKESLATNPVMFPLG